MTTTDRRAETRRTGEAPDPASLDPAERMGVDELRALQLERLQWTLRHAYDNVPHYRARLRRRRRAPRRLPRAGRPREVPDHVARPTCARTTRSACSPSRRSRSAGCTPPPARPAGRPSSATPSATSTPGPRSWPARSARPGGRPGDVLHNAYGYGLFTGGLGAHYGAEKLGCTVIPISGGMTPAAGAADPRLRAARDHGDAVLHAHRHRRVGEAGHRPAVDLAARSASSAPSRGPSRCGRRWRSASTSTPSTSTGCRRSWAPASPRSAWRPRTGCTSGRTTSIPEVIDPITGEVLPDGEEGELVFTSLTKEAMPVIRYRTRDLTRLLPGHRAAGHAPDGEDHRPHRRHDHPARGQPLPDADRGDRAAHPGPVAALRARADHPRPDGPPHRPGRGPARLPRRAPDAAAAEVAEGGQGHRRHQRRRARRRPGDAAPVGRQAAAADATSGQRA